MPHSSLHLTAWRLDSPPVQLSGHTNVVVMSRDEILLKLRLSVFKITCRGLRSSSALRARDPKCWPGCSVLVGRITVFLWKQQGQVWSWIRCHEIPWETRGALLVFLSLSRISFSLYLPWFLPLLAPRPYAGFGKHLISFKWNIVGSTSDHFQGNFI